jgi:hypothetical protein
MATTATTTAKTRKRVKGNHNAARSFRMSEGLLRKFDAHCDRHGVTRSELLRRFISSLPMAKDKTKHVRVTVV